MQNKQKIHEGKVSRAGGGEQDELNVFYSNIKNLSLRIIISNSN
jgi:hypothetical protein